MSHPVVIDVETQHVFAEVGGDIRKLRISVAGLYDYATDQFHTFMEPELSELFKKLENASQVIGFNIVHFDLPALSPYYVGNLLNLPTLDLMHAVEDHLGHRLSLDDLLRETLGSHKEGHGLAAIDFFREGKINELTKYCLSDVRLTKELYEYGKKNGKIYFKSAYGRQEIPVVWNTNSTTTAQDFNLTLPL